MTAHFAESDRLLELLADRATAGLEETDVAELDRLIEEAGDIDADCMDRAAASLDLAFLDQTEFEPMPAEVRTQVEHRIAKSAGDNGQTIRPVSDQPAPVAGRIGPLGAFGWLAAAACLALAAVAWLNPNAPTAPSFAEIAAAPDVIRVNWAPGPDESGANASGEVVWSDERQAGYMVFRGLPHLDPGENTYQLWIFDPDKDEHPVDGGVFNVPAGEDEVRVPINAKLSVDDPSLFAVTIEQPGGVVVSKQERIPVLAQVPSETKQG